MAQIQSYLCEVCGQHKQPGNTHWYLLAENQWRSALDLFVWDDKLAGEPDMMHVCCPEHVECLICEWLQPASAFFPRAVDSEPDPSDFRRAALRISELSVDRSLIGFEDGRRVNVMSVLNAIEVVLEACDAGVSPGSAKAMAHCDA